MRSSIVIAALVVAACSDSTSPTQTGGSPLTGLASSVAKDSAGATVPQPSTSTSSGSFHGTVLGPSAAGAGNDSLNTAPRVAGVVVTAYSATGTSTANPTLGTAVATVTTGADGKFQFGELPGGNYVVTFTPPGTSVYGGVWVTATAHSGSNQFPWWVVLWKK